ncbi:hypothetical protein EDB89DRAFT_1271243 [Lactarius sanguifluus]|nr:hypothetical protein EDB89DRAFT_1271243 [Lactarius sanguifluus]
MAELGGAVFSDNSLVPIDGEPRVDGHDNLCKSSMIGVLPEEVVLGIFYFYKLDDCPDRNTWEWRKQWPKLAQVCRQWRTIIFASQRRLDLRLLCTPKKSIPEALELWPAIPISMRPDHMMSPFPDDDIAALRQYDRFCEISLQVHGPLFERICQIMQGPFPLLEELSLSSTEETVRVLPSTFLGGSAPRLRVLSLVGIVFPALPRLLSSASDLVHLYLQQRVSSTEYFSPEALVSGLSASTRLKYLSVYFARAKSRSNPRDTVSPPSEPIVFSALTNLGFSGTCKYLEDLLSRISAPSLGLLRIRLFDQPSFDDVFQLSKFLGRMEPPKLPNLVEVTLGELGSSLTFPRSAREGISDWLLVSLSLPLQRLELSLITHICRQISPLLSSVRCLEVETFHRSAGNEDVVRWLDLLRVFDRVDELLIIGDACPNFARALQRVSAEMAADALPALRKLTLSPFTSESEEAVTSFIDARNLAGLPAIRLNEPAVSSPG